MRLSLECRLEKAKIPLQIDIGFGDVLTPEFHDDRAKQAQWQAFLRKGKLGPEGFSLRDVAMVRQAFLMPLLAYLAARRASNVESHRGGLANWSGDTRCAALTTPRTISVAHSHQESSPISVERSARRART